MPPLRVMPADPAKKFATLMKKVASRHGAVACDPAHDGRPQDHSPLLWQLVFSFLAWEASPSRAAQASKRLHASVVDYNEMRVCLPEELLHMIGERYPRGLERVTRLRATLNDIFRRQNAVTLDHLPAMNKKEARAYLESLDGCPPFAAARVTLFELDGHALPLDERLMASLVGESALPERLSLPDAIGWIERQLRVGEARDTYLRLEAWHADVSAGKPAAKPAAEAKAEANSASKAEVKPDNKPERSGASRGSGGAKTRRGKG